MDPSSPYRPRVSRETRHLLIAGALAVGALWILARLSSDEPSLVSGPVPAVLGQLTASPRHDDLAAEIAQLQARVEPALLVYDRMPFPSGAGATRRLLALRLRDDIAVALVPGASVEAAERDSRIRAVDPASGLVVLQVPDESRGPLPVPWVSRQLQRPRYFVASDPSADRVALRPVFVTSLGALQSPLWSGPVWAAPIYVEWMPGSFVFTNSAELVGLVTGDVGGSVVIPPATVLAESERLLGARRGTPGALGIEVQPLTPPLSTATGAPAGVVVSWVVPEGAASGHLAVGDVIEAVDDRLVRGLAEWDAHVARVSVGDMVRLRVRRGGQPSEFAVLAAAAPARAGPRPFGLTLRARPGLGSEVVRVAPGSAADAAGLLPGDVITLAGDAHTPTPPQVAAAFNVLAQGQPALIAITRGTVHQVTTLTP